VAVTVARLCHYPVKGVAGRELDAASLVVGRGLPYDRAVALTNGTAPWRGGGRPPRELLLSRSRNPGLTRLRLDVDDSAGTSVTVTAPDDSSFRIDLDDLPDPEGAAPRRAQLCEASPCLAGRIPAGRYAPQVVRTDLRSWERPEAELSLVGLATVEQLGRAWRTTFDPDRLRANVYLSGLEPDEELALVGRVVRLGAAELEILRPLERGAGADVDPVTGATDLDVPRLLDADVGHRFVGVYARVRRPGQVRRGDQLVAVPRPVARTWGTDSMRAWPRRLQVDAVLPEPRPRTAAEGTPVKHLWVRDPLGLVPRVRPGEHVRLHAVDGDGPFWRSYTVSGVDGGLCRLSVALEPGGRMARYLEKRQRDELAISVTGPFGDPTPPPADRSGMLLISAGIGITPTVALLRDLVDQGSPAAVRVLHVDRYWPPPLWSELCALLGQLPGASRPATLHLTRETTATAQVVGARLGRPAVVDLLDAVATVPGEPSVLVCGSVAFGAEVRSALVASGVPGSAVHQEAFYSPPPERPQQGPVDPGPFAVRFASARSESEWTSPSGTLLDVAEAAGLCPPVDCRVGACNVCATAVTAGTTVYTTPPMVLPPEGTVLICCSVPTSDVTLAL
jgi:ferredoxin-NADP reductase/uncharacterized protein YcbX